MVSAEPEGECAGGGCVLESAAGLLAAARSDGTANMDLRQPEGAGTEEAGAAEGAPEVARGTAVTLPTVEAPVNFLQVGTSSKVVVGEVDDTTASSPRSPVGVVQLEEQQGPSSAPEWDDGLAGETDLQESGSVVEKAVVQPGPQPGPGCGGRPGRDGEHIGCPPSQGATEEPPVRKSPGLRGTSFLQNSANKKAQKMVGLPWKMLPSRNMFFLLRKNTGLIFGGGSSWCGGRRRGRGVAPA